METGQKPSKIQKIDHVVERQKRLDIIKNALNVDEVLNHILSFLPAVDLVSSSLVSRKWRDYSQSNTLWRRLYYYYVHQLGKIESEQHTIHLSRLLASSNYNVPPFFWKRLFMRHLGSLLHLSPSKFHSIIQYGQLLQRKDAIQFLPPPPLQETLSLLKCGYLTASRHSLSPLISPSYGEKPSANFIDRSCLTNRPLLVLYPGYLCPSPLERLAPAYQETSFHFRCIMLIINPLIPHRIVELFRSEDVESDFAEQNKELNAFVKLIDTERGTEDVINLFRHNNKELHPEFQKLQQQQSQSEVNKERKALLLSEFLQVELIDELKSSFDGPFRAATNHSNFHSESGFLFASSINKVKEEVDKNKCKITTPRIQNFLRSQLKSFQLIRKVQEMSENTPANIQQELLRIAARTWFISSSSYSGSCAPRSSDEVKNSIQFKIDSLSERISSNVLFKFHYTYSAVPGALFDPISMHINVIFSNQPTSIVTLASWGYQEKCLLVKTDCLVHILRHLCARACEEDVCCLMQFLLICFGLDEVMIFTGLNKEKNEMRVLFNLDKTRENISKTRQRWTVLEEFFNKRLLQPTPDFDETLV